MTQPLRVLSLGAGVQSSTLLWMMIEGEIPKADHAIFSDTGWEPKAVYEHLDYLRGLMEKAGIEFHMVSHGNIKTDGLADLPWFLRGEGGDKGILRRQCTARYKLDPIRRKQRELVGLQPGQRSKEHLLTTVIGISWDEAHRMKDPFYNWMTNEYPLVDRKITRADCIKWAEEHGYPRPPRSSCLGCPFHSNKEWLHIRTNFPEEFEETCRVEEEFRATGKLGSNIISEPFLHSQRVPLREAILTESDRGQMSMFGEECEGMCGL